MTDQLSFDPPASALAAELGMAQAYSAERVVSWREAAEAWLLAQSVGQLITADDLIAAVGLPDEGVNRNNAVGALFSAASKRGQIVFAHSFRKSARTTRHVGLQRVWRVAV